MGRGQAVLKMQSQLATDAARGLLNSIPAFLAIPRRWVSIPFHTPISGLFLVFVNSSRSCATTAAVVKFPAANSSSRR